MSGSKAKIKNLKLLYEAALFFTNNFVTRRKHFAVGECIKNVFDLIFFNGQKCPIDRCSRIRRLRISTSGLVFCRVFGG